MTRSQPTPTWPFLSILVALFILSLSAPRSWESVARKAPLGDIGADQANTGKTTDAVDRPESAARLAEARRRTGTPTLAPPQERVAGPKLEPSLSVANDAATGLVDESFADLQWPNLGNEPLMCEAELEWVGPSLATESTSRSHFIDPLGLIPEWLTEITSDQVFSSVNVTPAATAPRVASRPGHRHGLKIEEDSEFNFRREASSAADVNQAEEPTRSMWREPTALLEALDHLAWECSCSDWAVRVGVLIRELTNGRTTTPAEADAILTELRGELERAEELAAATDDYRLASELRRLRHAVVRRVEVWDLAVRLDSKPGPELVGKPIDAQPLAAVLAKVDALVDQAEEPSGWREYLMLDSLGVLAQSRQGHITERSRQLADLVLARLDAHHLTADQRRLMTDGPIASLNGSLRAWAVRPMATSEFLWTLERYETTGLPSDAATLARLCNRLEWSQEDDQQKLALATNRYYRNANFRIAITEELLERILPERQLQWQPVHDTIAGVPVRGNSTVRTDFDVELVPDAQRLRLLLDISGLISAQTQAGGDWGTVFNSSNSHYAVQQPLEIGPDGMHLGEPTAEVDSQVQLQGVETRFDGVPVLGPVAQSLVRRGQEKRAPDARRESERKIRRKALEQAGKEASERFSTVEERFKQEIVKPLTAMGLDPELIEMKTTDQRITVRARIAGENQLGSHTPRPRAPSDSLASVQLHQSAVNNLIERLDLNGREMSLVELHAHILEKLGREPRPAPESLPQDVQIRFADVDAVRIACGEEEVRITLAIEELSKRPRRWSKFTVHVNYHPSEDVSEGRLVREGTIQLAGRRLNMGSQIALRGVFSKIFADEGLQLVPEKIQSDPRFEDLEVTQLTITDGWIAAALGPKRPENKSLAVSYISE